MGNYFNKQSTKDLLKSMIDEYKAGDIEGFVRIAEFGKDYNDLKEFRVWKIGCLYYFIINMPNQYHDIGYYQDAIISEYYTLSASDDEITKKILKNVTKAY